MPQRAKDESREPTSAAELRQQIVEFLLTLPNLHNSEMQQALIFSASLDPQLESQIQANGLPPGQFVSGLVSTLLRYGKLHDGRAAIEAILQAAKQYVSQEKQAHCDWLIQALQSQSNHKESTSPNFIPVDYKQEDIFEYYKIFVGRQKEIDAIQEFLQGTGGEYLLIQGKPGMGKTALVVKLADMGKNKTFGEQLSCLVFFVREEGGCNTPERFLDALNHQLLRLLGESEEVAIHFSERKRQYERLWEKVNARVSPQNKLLVLIDGLDESCQKGKQPLADYFPAKIYPNIYWVLTSRPLPDVLATIPTTHVLRQAHSYWLSGLEPEEVRELLVRNGDQIERSEAFIAHLIERTNGEPLFLRFLCQDIADKTEADAEAYIKTIPESVSEYFQRQLSFLWDRTRQAGDKNLLMDILTTLLVSFSGLTVKEFAGILQRKPFEIRESLKLIERFLIGEEHYELMHLEFRRTIEEELVRDDDKKAALDSILVYCEQNWQKDDPQEHYALHYYLKHLYRCKHEDYSEKIFTLCEDRRYLDLKLGRLISPGLIEEDYQILYDTCRETGDLMRLLQWGLHRTRISDQVIALRDIIFFDEHAGEEKKIIPELIGELAQQGRWDWWEWGSALCGQVPGIAGKIKGFLGLCKGLKPGGISAPQKLFERISRLLEEMPSGENQDGLTCEYAQELCRWGATYIGQALEAANQIVDDFKRSEALTAVAQGYTQLGEPESAAQMLAQALKATIQVVDDINHFKALKAVVQSYAQLGQSELAAQGLRLVFETTNQRDYDSEMHIEVWYAIAEGYTELERSDLAAQGLRLMSEVAHQLPSEHWYLDGLLNVVARGYARLEESDRFTRSVWTLETAIQIVDGEKRAAALCAVADDYAQLKQPNLAIQGLQLVFEVAIQIADEDEQASVLRAVAQGYAQQGQSDRATRVLAQALEAVIQIADEWDRTAVLHGLVSDYAQLKQPNRRIEGLRLIFEAAIRVTDKNNRPNVLSAILQRDMQPGQIDFDPQGLVQALETAIQIADEEERAVALCAVALGYVGLGQLHQAVQVLAQALEAAAQVFFECYRSRTLSAVAQGYVQLTNPDLAIQGLRAVLEAVVQIDDKKDRSNALYDVALGYAQLGRPAPVAQELEFVLEVVARRADISPAEILRDIVQEYAQIKQPELAAQGLKWGLKAATRFADEWECSRALWAVALGYAQLGQPDLAARELELVLEAVTHLNHKEGRLMALGAVARGYMNLGQTDLAASGLQRVIDTPTRVISEKERAEALFALAHGYMDVGQPDRADLILAHALEAATQLADVKERSWALCAVASEYVSLGQSYRAARILAQALETAVQITEENERLSILYPVVWRYGEIGQSDLVAPALQQVLDTATRLTEGRNHLQLLSAVAQAYAKIGQRDRADQVLTQAMEIATRLTEEEERSRALYEMAQGYSRIEQPELAIQGLQRVFEVAIRLNLLFVSSEVARGYAQIGQSDLAAQVLRQVFEAATQTVNERNRSWLLGSVVEGYASLKDSDLADQGLRWILETAAQLTKEDELAMVLHAVTKVYASLRESDLTVQGLRLVCETVTRLAKERNRSWVICTVAQSYATSGQAIYAIQGLQQVFDMAIQFADERERSLVLGEVALGYAQLGQPNLAAQVLVQALKTISPKHSNELWRESTLGNVIQRCMQFGQVNLIAQDLRLIVETAAQLANKDCSEALGMVALGYVQLGRTDLAVQLLAQAVEAAAQLADEREQSIALEQVVVKYVQMKKFSETTNLLPSISWDGSFLFACRTIFEAVEALSEDNASDCLIDTLYRVFPLVSQRCSRQAYLEVIQDALPALTKHLPKEQVLPILTFLEEQWKVNEGSQTDLN